MKVLIFPGYGGDCYTKEMKKAIDGSDKLLGCRVGRVVEVVEKAEIIREIGYADSCDDIIEDLKANRGKIIGVTIKQADTEKVRYYTWCNKPKELCQMAVVDVKTSRPWRIAEYDGAEGIEYYSEPEILDKNSNYARW